MSTLVYYYASMNAGKSTSLLQTAYNHKENGHKVLYFTSALDDRYGVGTISSRIGINSEATVIPKGDLTVLHDACKMLGEDLSYNSVYVDECQFLTKEQVDILSDIVDNYGVKVYCYGIRTDFESNLFEGSARLFEIADEIIELKNVCACGKDAKMNARMVDNTEKVFIGGNESYKSMCRKCFKDHMRIRNGSSN